MNTALEIKSSNYLCSAALKTINSSCPAGLCAVPSLRDSCNKNDLTLFHPSSGSEKFSGRPSKVFSPIGRADRILKFSRATKIWPVSSPDTHLRSLLKPLDET